jgi:5'-nucleotidase
VRGLQTVKVKTPRVQLDIPVTSGSRPSVLLTNDDGIDKPGIRILYEKLSELADVTVVAPRVDHSGIGRTLSFGRPVPLRTGEVTDSIDFEESALGHDIPFENHELGYAVSGTPCDCVIAGVTALTEPDVVVSGCNPGANVGTAAFSRSGTVAAALEAAHFGIPSVAVSSKEANPSEDRYHRIAELTERLLTYALSEDVFDRADYLNLVAPGNPDPPVEITQPADDYRFIADIDESEDAFRFTWKEQPEHAAKIYDERMLTPDREAIRRDCVSVSPLQIPYTPTQAPALEAFAESHGE